MRKFYYLSIAVLLIPFLLGCPKPATTIKEEYKVNQWVYKQMYGNYLWRDELPSFDDSDPLTPTQDYFDVNLRYRDNRSVALNLDYDGDRFSYIDYTGKDETRSRTVATEKEYGFGFLLSRVVDGSTLVHLQVLYVIPGTPADNAGIRRGDAFDTINGVKISNDNWESQLSASSITIAILNRETEDGEPVEITIRKGYYYDNPILFDTIYYDTEPVTAYLVYNHFTNGDKSGDAAYAEKLKEIFRGYGGVENLILDLRYNGGGEINNAILLASLIAPASMLGKEFVRMQTNDAVKDWNKFTPYTLETLNENADIKKLFVITSGGTASASELIIHTMKPIFRDAGREVYVVGETTYGKNLGGLTFKGTQYEWDISLITMRVYNLDKVSGYEHGIAPDTKKQDKENVIGKDGFWILPRLGDYEHENLLNIVFQQFTDVAPVFRSAKTRSGEMPQSIPMVRQRELTGGTVLID